MPHYSYLIIGGGMTAAAALAGIREIDLQGSIGLISAEQHPPYQRPLLSKGLWRGKPLHRIWRKTDYPEVDLLLNRKIVRLDPQNKQIFDEQGNVYTFDKLLLATGGSPRKLPFGNQRIIYYRTLDDYNWLRELSDEGSRFAVIGGGFIGSEISASLADNGQKVVMIFPEAGIGALVFPPDLSQFLNSYYREKGVEVLAGELVTGQEERDEQLILRTKSGNEIIVDAVIAGIGIQPNIELARDARLKVENGITTDEYLHTSAPDIFTAGDVANFYNPLLGKRLRVEHEDNTEKMGRLAGQNMAREKLGISIDPYGYLPFFYSDLFDLGYEAVGELNPKLNVVADWQEPYRKGVIYYLEGGCIKGVLLWNVWGQVDAARKLMNEPGPFTAEKLKGRLPASM